VRSSRPPPSPSFGAYRAGTSGSGTRSPTARSWSSRSPQTHWCPRTTSVVCPTYAHDHDHHAGIAEMEDITRLSVEPTSGCYPPGRPADPWVIALLLVLARPRNSRSMAQAMITRVSAEEVDVEEAILALDIDALGARAGSTRTTTPSRPKRRGGCCRRRSIRPSRISGGASFPAPKARRSRLLAESNRRRSVSRPRQEPRGGPRVGGGLPRRSRRAGGIDATRDRPRLSAMVARTRMTADTQQG
jgi:hypothetical protein